MLRVQKHSTQTLAVTLAQVTKHAIVSHYWQDVDESCNENPQKYGHSIREYTPSHILGSAFIGEMKGATSKLVFMEFGIDENIVSHVLKI